MRRGSSQGKALSVHGLRRAAVLAFCALALAGCAKPEPLTKEKVDELLRAQTFRAEPIYAEVPQRVSYGPKSPMDDYDAKAVRTLHNLQAAGLVTVTETHDPDGTSTFVAKVTEKGFNILGTMPSARGPVYRGRICDKIIDGVRDFQRHPNDPLVGRAALAWHYDNPTWLYPLFETKINKPLKKPFESLVSFFYKDHAWRYEVTVKKTEVE
jgi:hypothetical protein